MNSAKHPSQISKAAYRAFVTECSQQIDRFDEVLHKEHSPEKETLKGAKNAFHTMKGGAGFFGLRDVASYASALESMLTSADLNVNSARVEIEELFEALKGAVVKLPEPE